MYIFDYNRVFLAPTRPQILDVDVRFLELFLRGGGEGDDMGREEHYVIAKTKIYTYKGSILREKHVILYQPYYCTLIMLIQGPVVQNYAVVS